MILKANRTIYNIDLQTHLLTGLKYKPLLNTTLNEYFNILKSSENDLRNPILDYFMFGLPVYDDNNGKKRHSVIDGILYKPMPFIAREINSDLSIEERKNYRIRIKRTIDSKEYYFYMLKKITDNTQGTNYITGKVIDENKIDINRFNNNDISILNPNLRTNKDYDFIALNKYINLTMSLTEIDELKNATKLFYGIENINDIGYIALCHGVDENTDFGKEVVKSQVSYFIDTDIVLNRLIEKDLPLYLTIEIGGMEKANV